MTVFFFKKNTLIISGILVLTIISLLSMHLLPTSAIEISANAGKLLPIYSVETDEKKVALSFDAAWGNEDLRSILDTLKENNVKTTFFVVGSFAGKYPEDIKNMADAGHDVVNHSDTHAHMAKLKKSEIMQELKGCDEKIYKIIGKNQPLFRPPYGEYNNTVIEAATEAGYYTVQWDVDSLDWKNLSVDEIVKRVTTKVRPGSIVLLHNGAKNTAAALPLIIKHLKDDGYSIVPVSELILRDGYTIDHTGRQIPDPLQ